MAILKTSQYKGSLSAKVSIFTQGVTNSLGSETIFMRISLSVENSIKYTDPDGRTLNDDGTVTYDSKKDNTLDKMAKSAGWNDWKEAVQANNKGAIFYRGYSEISATEIASWYNDDGSWKGGNNTLKGITMSNKNPAFKNPVSGNISIQGDSAFGPRKNPVSGLYGSHRGVDIARNSGSRVDTTAFGVVAEIGIGNAIYGNYVIMNHGGGFRTMYAHLSKIAWGAGTVLHHNTKLGEVGNTGQSTASHLHYEVHINGTPVNPANYIR